MLAFISCIYLFRSGDSTDEGESISHLDSLPSEFGCAARPLTLLLFVVFIQASEVITLAPVLTPQGRGSKIDNQFPPHHSYLLAASAAPCQIPALYTQLYFPS